MIVITDPAGGTETPAPQRVPGRRQVPPGRLADLVTVGCYLAAALYVTSSLWLGLRDRMVAGYGTQDQAAMEWFLAHAARSVVHLENPLFSTRLNAPFGVNMMANTNILGLGIPLAPVTLLLGPQTSFAILVTLAFAGTAFAWYYVLSRHVVSSRVAAFIGGACCGFAPGMVSEANGHLQIAAQFLIPLIALQILKLRRPERRWLNATLLGLLVAYQCAISEETLFLTGQAVGLFIVVYALFRREVLAGFLNLVKGSAITLGVAGLFLAYPLYRQFLGTGHYSGLPFAPSLIFVDLASYLSFPTNSLIGNGAAGRLAHTTAEETSFFGWPLLVVVAVLAVWLWHRDVRARVATICAVVFALLSLGFEIFAAGSPTGIPGPFRLLGFLPLFNLVVAARFGLVVIPFIGLLLALGYEHAAAGRPFSGVAARRPQLIVLAAIVLAVLPIVPLPLPTTSVPAIPAFISSGTWRAYVAGNRTLVTVPTTSSFALDGMRWSASTNVGFRMPRGYFLGPGAPGDGHPLYGAVPTWTSIILDQVSISGQPYQKQPGDETLLRTDLRLWHAGVLVLSTKQANAAALRTTLEQFLGSPQTVDDVWLWDVRGS